MKIGEYTVLYSFSLYSSHEKTCRILCNFGAGNKMANLPQSLPFGHCIKSCILHNFGDCEKPSAHADALGMATSDNEMLC
ncbi:hypothetical protein, partial [Ectobacillus funiculus]|uniref:hypothetical protein n=1 Tax=Ectobacillus funiculus TaxID=137993 RepID=UPI00196B89A9